MFKGLANNTDQRRLRDELDFFLKDWPLYSGKYRRRPLLSSWTEYGNSNNNKQIAIQLFRITQLSNSNSKLSKVCMITISQ